MFGFLKKKLKETVDKFSKKAQEDAEVIEEDNKLVVEEPVESIQEETSKPVQESKDAVEESEEDVSTPEEKTEFEEVVKFEEETNPVGEAKESLIAKPIEAVQESFVEEVQEDVVQEPEPVQEDIVEKKIEPEDEVVVEEKEEIIPDTEVIVSDEEDKELIDAPEKIFEEESKKADLPEVVEDEVQESTEDVSPSLPEDVQEVLVEEQVVVPESVEESVDTPKEPEKKKKGFFKSLFSKKSDDEEEILDAPENLIDKDIGEELVSVREDITVVKETKDVVEDSEKTIEEPKEEIESEEKLLSDSDKLTTDSLSVEEKPKREAVHKDLLDEDIKDTTKKKKGFFSKIKERVVKFKLTDEAFEDLFWEFELVLLENNVALEVIEKIKSDLHKQLTQENVTRKSIEEVMLETLKKSLDEVLDIPPVDLLSLIRNRSSDPDNPNVRLPFVMCVVGVNGSGKTTTIGKIIHYLLKNDLSVVVAASDTFRAAAIDQLQEHTDKLGVKLIKHDYNSDPSAVAFDAIKHAKAKGVDVVLIDTAGRLQSNSNLMDELRKLVRVNSPDFNLFIGESITGNDCVEQAVAFNDAVGINGIVLSKADIDDKGGAALSVSYVTGKPILFLGMGQTYDDLKVFDKDEVLSNLGL